MGVFEVAMRIHSSQDISKDITGLNPCVVHGVMPVIVKRIYGRHRETIYLMQCPGACACDRCTDDEKQIATIWNKWNPLKT